MTINEINSRNDKVRSWVDEFVMTEPMRSDLFGVIDDADQWNAINKLRYKDSLASDGWEMIEAAFRRNQADEIT